MSNSDSDSASAVPVRIGLHIEEDEDIPTSCVAVAQDPETDVWHIVATNWEPSDEGARAVADMLDTMARAIREKLGDTVPEGVRAAMDRRRLGETVRDVERREQSARPRFNPKPRKMGPASEGGA